MDGGPGLAAADSAEVGANRGALLIHGEANYPEGHGKVERFNQTAKAQSLRALDGRPDVDPACGGVRACATCHVIVRTGFETRPEASEDEEDQLDTAPGLEPTSRLACQAVPDGSTDLVVEIPSWNRNHAREEH